VKRKKRAAAAVVCPFCGEAEELFVDLGGGEHQSYIEDCSVCCRPRVVTVSPGEFDGDVQVTLERDD
jgi:hypothetical protein